VGQRDLTSGHNRCGCLRKRPLFEGESPSVTREGKHQATRVLVRWNRLVAERRCGWKWGSIPHQSPRQFRPSCGDRWSAPGPGWNRSAAGL